MKINKTWWIIAVVLLSSALVGQLILPGILTPAIDNEQIVLYHTPDCPHCQDVKAYIIEREIAGIIKKDISENRVNANELYQRMTQCGRDVSAGLVVPVLWDEGRCFVGRDEVMSHLETMILSVPLPSVPLN